METRPSYSEPGSLTSISDLTDTTPLAERDLDEGPQPGQPLGITSIILEERCGDGGSGTVFRATDTRDGRPLAIKLLRPGMPREMLVHEADALACIHSPGIVRCEGLGTLPSGCPWLALEYVPGHPLSRVLATGPVEPRRLLHWFHEICRVLVDVHDAGWVHRDIKPSNVMLTRDESTGEEHIVLVDFGIADRIGSRSRELSGTPDYIAPEQVRREPADPRSDLYSLGCCMYHMLTGKRLVSTPDPQRKLDTHVDGITPSWPADVDAPPALRRVIDRCLAHSMSRRPASARALLAELEPIIDSAALGRPASDDPGPRAPGPDSTPAPRRRATLVGHPGVCVHRMDTLPAAEGLSPS